jgi:hypothetical protein
MSKTQVAAFIKTIAEMPELNSRVAAVERTPAAWVGVAKSLGVEFSVQDFVDFVTEVTDRPADANDAVRVLLGHSDDLTDSDLDGVVGGAAPAKAPSKITVPKAVAAAVKKNYVIPCI